MKRTLLWLLIVSACSTLMFVSCGGGDDDDDDSSNSGDEVTSDDIEGMVQNCDPNSTDPCEVMICSLKDAVESCDEQGVTGACDAFLQCVADYYNCICANGVYSYSGYEGCYQDYSQCIIDAGFGFGY